MDTVINELDILFQNLTFNQLNDVINRMERMKFTKKIDKDVDNLIKSMNSLSTLPKLQKLNMVLEGVKEHKRRIFARKYKSLTGKTQRITKTEIDNIFATMDAIKNDEDSDISMKGGAKDQDLDSFLAEGIQKMNLDNQEVNELIGDIQKMNIITPKKVMSSFEKILMARGKSGKQRKRKQNGGSKQLDELLSKEFSNMRLNKNESSELIKEIKNLKIVTPKKVQNVFKKIKKKRRLRSKKDSLLGL